MAVQTPAQIIAMNLNAAFSQYLMFYAFQDDCFIWIYRVNIVNNQII